MKIQPEQAKRTAKHPTILSGKKTIPVSISPKINANSFVEKLKVHQSATELKKIKHYFKSDEGDKFMGVRMGQVFALAKEFVGMLPSEIEKLLDSPIHEIRVGAVSIMDFQARNKKTP